MSEYKLPESWLKIYRRIGKCGRTKAWREYQKWFHDNLDKINYSLVNKIANIIGSSGDHNTRLLAGFYLYKMLRDIGQLDLAFREEPQLETVVEAPKEEV